VEYLGADSYLFVRTPQSGELTVRVNGVGSAALGSEVGIAPLPGRLLRFDKEGQRMSTDG
jgi:hypothetical protein